jgi:hypothetical protein
MRSRVSRSPSSSAPTPFAAPQIIASWPGTGTSVTSPAWVSGRLARNGPSSTGGSSTRVGSNRKKAQRSALARVSGNASFAARRPLVSSRGGSRVGSRALTPRAGLPPRARSQPKRSSRRGAEFEATIETRGASRIRPSGLVPFPLARTPIRGLGGPEQWQPRTRPTRATMRPGSTDFGCEHLLETLDLHRRTGLHQAARDLSRHARKRRA